MITMRKVSGSCLNREIQLPITGLKNVLGDLLALASHHLVLSPSGWILDFLISLLLWEKAHFKYINQQNQTAAQLTFCWIDQL